MASRYNNPRTLIFTATYNERDNIGNLLDKIFALDSSFEVLVVDDDSPDMTGQYLNELSVENPRLHVIHRHGKLGLGSAHQFSFLYAIRHDFDRLITMDADLSHDPDEIPRLLAALEHADFVIGSRYVEGGSSDYTGYRKLLSVSANTLARLLLRIPLYEFTTSFRAFDVEMLKTCLSADLPTTWYSFFMENVYWLHAANVSLAEVPIQFRDRQIGVSKIPQYQVINGIVSLLKLTWSAWIGGRKFKPATGIDDICAYCGSPYLIEIYPPSLTQGRGRHDAAAYQCSSMEHKNKPQVVQCLQCNLKQVPQKRQPEDLEELYGDVEDLTYLENRAARELNFSKTYDRIAPFLPATGRMLEVGAYCGLFLNHAQKAGWDCVGVEPSNWATRIANEEIGVKVHAGTLAGNLEKLRDDYDVVVSWDVLEHVKAPYQLLQEIHAVMKPGGVLCLSTLDMDNWFPRLLGRHWPWLMQMHLYYFSRSLLYRWFERAGFEILHIDKYRHYASLKYIWSKGMAILPSPMARILRPIGHLVPSLVIPVSFGDIKLFIIRKHHEITPPDDTSDDT